MESKSKLSVLQGVCATIVLIAYFLPWFQISLLGFENSTSLFDVILKSNQFANNVSDYSSQMFSSETKGIRALLSLLFLVPIFAFINMIIQWASKAPRAAFYFNLIPVGICVALIINVVKSGIDITSFAGIGFYIAFIAGLVSFIAAWTTIGLHYYCRYKRYMKILTYCTLIAIGLFFLSIIIKLQFNSLYEPKAVSIIGSVLMFLSIILEIISLPHFPFLVYAWIIVLCTKKSQKESLTVLSVTEEVIESEQKEKGTAERCCPECYKIMESDWITCPYCGHGSKETEEKNQEEDNLRFAPPGSRLSE